jgi:hypothetical protein
LWTAHASACASRSARKGRLRMPRRKHSDASDAWSLLRLPYFFVMCNGPILLALLSAFQLHYLPSMLGRHCCCSFHG